MNDLVTIGPANATLRQMRANPAAFPRVKAVSSEQAIAELAKMVTQAIMYRGQTPDRNNVAFIAQNLYAEIMDDKVYGAGSLSFAEIAKAIKRAVLADEMFGVNVATLYKAVLEYAKTEGHDCQLEIWKDNERRLRAEQDEIAGLLEAHVARIAKTMTSTGEGRVRD